MNNLTNSLFDYCEDHKLSIEKSQIKNIDYIITIKNKSIGVVIKDWNKAIRIDIVIQSEKAVKYTNHLSRFFILTNSYSEPAKYLADLISIPLLTFKEFEEKQMRFKA